MTPPVFRDFDPAAFLRDHWQKAPMLIRNPWREWHNPLSPEELAGLACEPEVESRLVRQLATDEWELEHGPLTPAQFAEQSAVPWTLLVQAVDHHVPEVTALLDAFRFLPNWRIDDVMVSYAVEGGGVGPHFDQYDVFLVQGLGRRRWRVGPRCDEMSELIPHDDLRLLRGFDTAEEWVLEPGDILYLPPGFAHDGVAVGGDCMTYSIGFRAPSRAELLSGWTDHLLDTLAEDDRYGDPGLRRTENPGEIAPDALARLREMVTDALADEAGFARWLGGHVTAPKSEAIDWAPEEATSLDEVRADLAAEAMVERNPASRFAFVRRGTDALTLFVDGVSYECEGASAAFAERLCAGPATTMDAHWVASEEVTQLIHTLVNHGSIALTAED